MRPETGPVIDDSTAIPVEARQMIEAAANVAGMSVSEWLNAVILNAAENAGVTPVKFVFRERQGPPNPTESKLASIQLRLDGLAEKIEHLAKGSFISKSAFS